MSDKTIKAGITQGSTNGISYELILKMFSSATPFETCIPILYGSGKTLSFHRKQLDLPAINIQSVGTVEEAASGRLNIIHVGSDDQPVELGKSTPESGAAADAALFRALDDLESGAIDILLLGPTESDPTPTVEARIAPGTGKGKTLKLLVNDHFRLALATGNVPLAEVSNLLNTESLTEKIVALRQTLIQDFQVTFPRIAVLSLNPAGESEDITTPAIQAAAAAGVLCFGPYASGDFFASKRYRTFDAALAMYHDQGTIAIRTLTTEEHAVYLGNLPHIIAASSLPAALDKAGKNESSPESLRRALHLAIDAFRSRQRHKEMSSNPLRRQFFERGSDNEKIDLTIDLTKEEGA
jgi:4-hydroxythreonine-4-phosphate dehydrogenase